MPNTTVRVVARVTAKPDCVESVKAILLGVVEPTRREPGNLSYQLLQNNSDPTDFTFVEEWTTAPAEQAHFSTSHILDALRKLPGLLAADPDIRRYSLLL